MADGMVDGARRAARARCGSHANARCGADQPDEASVQPCSGLSPRPSIASSGYPGRSPHHELGGTVHSTTCSQRSNTGWRGHHIPRRATMRCVKCSRARPDAPIGVLWGACVEGWWVVWASPVSKGVGELGPKTRRLASTSVKNCPKNG
jgi:hypothetical protein